MSYRLLLMFLVLVILTHYIQVKRNLDQAVESGHLHTTFRYLGEVDQKGSSYVYSSEGMKLILPERIQAKIGQEIEITGNVSRDAHRMPSLFSSEIRLINQRIVFKRNWTDSGIFLFGHFYEKILNSRGKMVNFLHFSLPEPHSSIATGMLLGERERFDAEEKQRLKSVGLMHVVAASGSNVVMATSLLEGVLSKMRSRWKLLLYLGSIWTYCSFASFSPTIVRASLMSSLQVGAQAAGREYLGVWALFLSATAMLLYDPYLVFSLSFQLSVLASLAMVRVYPLLLKIFHHENTRGIFASVQATFLSSVAVTLLSAPLLIYQFGSFSLISFFSNVALLWLVPYIMSFAFFTALLSGILPSYSSIFTIPIWICCEVWVRCVHFLAQVPMASVSIPPIIGVLMIIPSGYAVFIINSRAKYIF